MNGVSKYLTPVIKLVKEAGKGILDYYGAAKHDLNINKKTDKTLLTEADLCAHNIILSSLNALTPGVPVLSEEGSIPFFSARQQWQRYWIVDPLDGTRGFVDRRDEFVINVALIEAHQPILGVVYAPVHDFCYYAVCGEGAYKLVKDEAPQAIHTRPLDWKQITVLLGHYLKLPSIAELLADEENIEVVHLNSALKFCWIAEGKGDVYPRYGRTSEWDTAAPQCILQEAGGGIVDLEKKPLFYNQHESLINPPFVAVGDLSQAAKLIDFIQEKRRAL